MNQSGEKLMTTFQNDILKLFSFEFEFLAWESDRKSLLFDLSNSETASYLNSKSCDSS